MHRRISLAFLIVLSGAVVYGQQKDLYESFEAAWTGGVLAPLGWSQQIVSGSQGWSQTTMPLTGPGAPKGGAADHKYAAAAFASGLAGTTAILVTPEFDFTQEDSVRLNFRYVNISGTDTLRVRVSTDGGSTWATAASYGRSVDTTGGWQKVHLRLDALAGKPNVRIGFEGTADEGSSDIWLDRVVIQYPSVSIREIQEVPADSLVLADGLQRSNNNRWSLQRSWYYTDTLTVEGVVVIPALIVRFTSAGRNLLLSDTASPDVWGGLFIRANLSSTSPDTVLADDWGVQNVEPGDYVRLRAYIDEFPSPDMVSQTQAVPLYNPRIEILGSAPVPPHRPMVAADFYQGGFPGGSIRFSTGEPYEFMRVELTNLTVVGSVNLTNGTFAMQDAAGNQISTMDASKWFTTRGHRDPASTWALPPTFAAIDTIRGYVMANSGQEAARGYRIAPLYPGDVVVGAIRPQISAHRRNPVVVPPDSTPRISVRVTQLPGVELRGGGEGGLRWSDAIWLQPVVVSPAL